jgi:hypothetical protein
LQTALPSRRLPRLDQLQLAEREGTSLLGPASGELAALPPSAEIQTEPRIRTQPAGFALRQTPVRAAKSTKAATCHSWVMAQDLPSGPWPASAEDFDEEYPGVEDAGSKREDGPRDEPLERPRAATKQQHAADRERKQWKLTRHHGADDPGSLLDMDSVTDLEPSHSERCHHANPENLASQEPRGLARDQTERRDHEDG